jgi:hypothetical protein
MAGSLRTAPAVGTSLPTGARLRVGREKPHGMGSTWRESRDYCKGSCVSLTPGGPARTVGRCGRAGGESALQHTTEEDGNGKEREITGSAVADLEVGDRVEVLVGQPGRVGVLIRELCGTGILVCQGDDCEVVLGIGY